MASVDPQLNQAVADTRAQVRAAQAELGRRAADTARERHRLALRLADGQRALAEAREVLKGVEAPATASAQHRRRVLDDLLRLLSGLLALSAVAAAVGVLRQGPGWGPWVLVFPLVGLAAFFAARALSRRTGGSHGD